MVQLIKTTADVEAFFKCLLLEGITFHPDDDFRDYVAFGTGKRTYTDAQAKVRNEMTARCFEVCEQAGADIFEIATEVFQPELQKQIDEMELRWEARKYGETVCV